LTTLNRKQVRDVSSIGHPAESGAFLVDWDGVLADTRLDFASLRSKYFNGSIVPLFESASALLEPYRSEALAGIRRIEMEGAAAATAVEGAGDFISWLAERRKPWAVISRNCRDSIFLDAKRCGITLPPVTLCREDPFVKPDFRALKLAADRLGVALGDCVMVGDYIFDLQAAQNAEIPSVLVRKKTGADWEQMADYAYSTVSEFVEDLRAFKAS